MVRVTVTRIEWDGTMQRRMVDTAQRGDGPQWEDLTGRALALLPLYRPVPRAPVYHTSAPATPSSRPPNKTSPGRCWT
jgi:hypothetical protein